MTLRTLTAGERNRALLARQRLLERSTAPLPRLVEQVGGIQIQYAPSGYVGLWSRLEGFERAYLTRALERRSVVQGTLMRMTIHLVSARDYPLLAAGLREGQRTWWLGSRPGRSGGRRMESLAKRLRELLAEGPRPKGELTTALGVDATSWNGLGLWLDLVRAPPSGTWERRRADLYATAETWLGPSSAAPQDGIELLVRRYLGGFGPARPKDVAGWIGLPVQAVTPALARMELRRFADERGAELVDLPRAPLPDPETPAPVRFLPTWDATLLAHQRDTGILPEEYRPLVVSTQTPHSVGTFLVDGAVAGSWRYERDRVVTTPFRPLARDARRELHDEAERLSAFHR